MSGFPNLFSRGVAFLPTDVVVLKVGVEVRELEGDDHIGSTARIISSFYCFLQYGESVLATILLPHDKLSGVSRRLHITVIGLTGVAMKRRFHQSGSRPSSAGTITSMSAYLLSCLCCSKSSDTGPVGLELYKQLP